ARDFSARKFHCSSRSAAALSPLSTGLQVLTPNPIADAAELLGNLGECACKGTKCKAYHVSPRLNGDRTEDHMVGTQRGRIEMVTRYWHPRGYRPKTPKAR